MKLVYVTIFGPSDIHAWSGLGVYIHRALQNAGFQVETIGNLKFNYDFIYKAKEVIYTKVFSKTYRMLWDPILLRQFSIQVENALPATNCDVVFSIWTNPIAYLKTDKPVVFWGDATLAGLMERYAGYAKLCPETIRDGHTAEQLALTKCRLAIYSSEWAANTAVQNYDVDPAKVKVVPFGANIDCSRSVEDIRSILKNKDFEVCKLLFAGVDWFRKGGDLAVQVARLLIQRGIPAKLHVVGCHPPSPQPGFVIAHGFVSKTSGQGRQLLDQLFSQAHFFILPSRADCTPVVFPEACSFGLPVLTTNIGGIPTVIQDGKNGQTFPLDAGPEEYCDYIERLWLSRDKYEQLAISSFKEYSERLNWESAGCRIRDLIYQYCAS
jgi:glycosyltransferase involved in cell wall biosynthesis